MEYVSPPVGTAITCIWQGINLECETGLEDLLFSALLKDEFSVKQKFSLSEDETILSFALLAESHAYLNLNKDKGYVIFDLNSCRKRNDGEVTYEFLKNNFGPSFESFLNIPVPVNFKHFMHYKENLTLDIIRAAQKLSKSNYSTENDKESLIATKTIYIMFGIDNKIINDKDKINDAFLKSVNIEDIEALGLREHDFEPGVSFSLIHSNYNANLHTYPEHNSLLIDSLSLSNPEIDILDKGLLKDILKPCYELIVNFPITLDCFYLKDKKLNIAETKKKLEISYSN